MTFIPTVKRENLVLFLPFSEGSGSTAYDYSQTATSVTWYNSPLYVKYGDGGYAVDLNGSNQYGICNVASPSSITIVQWVKRDVPTDNDDLLVHKDNLYTSSSNRDFMQFIENNRLKFAVWNTSGNLTVLDSGVSWSTGSEWTMVTMTYDSSNGSMKIYVNTDLINSTTHSVGGSIRNSSTVVNIGRTNDNLASARYFNGKFRNITMYNVALTLNDIQQLYKQTYIQ